MKTSTKIKLLSLYFKEFLAFVGLLTLVVGTGICDTSIFTGFLVMLGAVAMFWLADLDYVCHMDEALTRVMKMKRYGR